MKQSSVFVFLAPLLWCLHGCTAVSLPTTSHLKLEEDMTGDSKKDWHVSGLSLVKGKASFAESAQKQRPKAIVLVQDSYRKILKRAIKIPIIFADMGERADNKSQAMTLAQKYQASALLVKDTYRPKPKQLGPGEYEVQHSELALISATGEILYHRSVSFQTNTDEEVDAEKLRHYVMDTLLSDLRSWPGTTRGQEPITTGGL